MWPFHRHKWTKWEIEREGAIESVRMGVSRGGLRVFLRSAEGM